MPDPTLETYGFRPATTRIAHDARARVLRYWASQPDANPPSTEDFPADSISYNDALVFVPPRRGWIGVGGHFILRGTDELIVLGSHVGLALHLWAYYRGIDLRDGAQDTLRILKVRNQSSTCRVLRQCMRDRYASSELARILQHSPRPTFSGLNLYFGLEALHEAESHQWFDFEVLPDSKFHAAG